MLNNDQKEIVRKVYNKFAESDAAGNEGWSEIDENMSYLDWLEDSQVVIEAAVKLQLQQQGVPRCNLDHRNPGDCFVPVVLEAVGYILDLYANTGHLPTKNRFILQYYLTLSQIGYILS